MPILILLLVLYIMYPSFFEITFGIIKIIIPIIILIGIVFIIGAVIAEFLGFKVFDYENNNYAQEPQQEKPKREPIPAGLRFKVLKRDNYRCRMCGHSAEDGVKLEIDHIIPVSRGGKNELNNLQTLCFRCNRGKGANFQ